VDIPELMETIDLPLQAGLLGAPYGPGLTFQGLPLACGFHY
jgi:hypothetical protein